MDQFVRNSLGELNFGDESDAKILVRTAGMPTQRKETQRKGTKRKETHYNMNHKNRGLALIFNHEEFESTLEMEERLGTKQDVARMEPMLIELGFKVFVYNDCILSKINERIDEAVHHDHTDYDCFVMVVLTHGGKNNYLYSYDGMYNSTKLWLPFTADSCRTLAGKPKLFFIQACRGPKFMPPVTLQSDSGSSSNGSYTIPSHADFLFFYSISPGYVSLRDTETGTWFIQALCREFEINAYKHDFLTLLTLVNQSVAIDRQTSLFNEEVERWQETTQIPCFTSNLTRLIRFEKKTNQIPYPDSLSNVEATVRFVEKNDETGHMVTSEEPYYMRYDMTHKNRGRALIFNHETFQVPEENLPTRTGTDVDAKLMKETLENLNFDVQLYKDLRYNTLMQHVNNVATFDHTDYDCFVMVVLSHGDNVDGILTTNQIDQANNEQESPFCKNTIEKLYSYDKLYMVEELCKPFQGHDCPTLAGKPKLFFFQAGRGKKFMQRDILNDNKTDKTGINTNYTIPSQADFLFAYSSIPGNESFRYVSQGSPFILALCQELNKNAYEQDLATILTFVNQKVAIDFKSDDYELLPQYKQMPCYTSKLTRLVQFNGKS